MCHYVSLHMECCVCEYHCSYHIRIFYLKPLFISEVFFIFWDPFLFIIILKHTSSVDTWKPFFSFQLLISAFEIFAVKRSLYFIMLDCSIDCNHSSINLLREHEWMMYERIVNSEIMILMFTKQGITFIFHMTSFFSFYFTPDRVSHSLVLSTEKCKKKKKKSNCRCWIVKSWWNLLEYFYSVFQLR